MRSLVFACMFAVAPIAVAEPTSIKMNADEISNLGIMLGKATPVNESTSSRFPAKVVIPNASQRVISAPQDGVIEVMYVAEGDHVKAKQPLAAINSPQLLKMQSDYLQSLTRLQQYKKDMLRDKSLFKDGIIAERRFLQSQSQYQQQQTEVSMYRKGLELAGMDSTALNKLTQTRTLNSHLTILADGPGVVMQQFATAGQRVSAADPLYRLAKLSPLWLEIHVPLHIAKQLKIKDKLSTCDQDLTGHVIALGRKVHDADQGVLVRGEIDKDTDQLTPGEFVETCFVTPTSGKLFDIPRGALFRNKGETAVFVRTPQGFDYRKVEIFNDNGTSVVVSGNLTADEQLVVSGTAALKAAWLGIGAE